MASGMLLELDASHHAVVNLLGLGTVLVLPIARVRLLRLQKQSASSIFPSRTCYLYSPFEHRSLQQRQLPKNWIQVWDSCYQMPSSKLVLNGDCACKTVKLRSCRYLLVFTRGFRFVLGKIWLSHCLAFHGLWNIVPVRCQKLCSCGFSHLGNYPGLATHTISSVEVVLASCHDCSSKPCLLFGPFEARIFTAKVQL